MKTNENPGTPSKEIWSAFLKAGIWVPSAFLLWLCWICADDWNHNPNYSFGWIIVPMFLFFAGRHWLEGNGICQDQGPIKPGLWLAGTIALGLLVLGIEVIRLAPLFWRPITWLVFLLFVGTFGFWFWRQRGLSSLRPLIFPVLLLSLAVPWPTFIELGLIREFSFLVAVIVGELLLLLGTYAEVSGRIIHLANGSVGVDEACSGLRSLQAALMVSLALGEWFRLNTVLRFLLLGLGILAALGTNLLRTLTLSLLVDRGGASALDTWHDPVGIVAMIGMTLVLVFIAIRLPHPSPKPSQEHHPGKIIPPAPDPMMQRTGLVILFFFLAAHSWYWIHHASPSSDEPFLTDDIWDAESLQSSPGPEVSAILRADYGGYLRFPHPPRDLIIAYHFFWKPSRANGKVFFHRPDVCMPGGGWSQEGSAQLTPGTLNGRPAVLHQFRFSRGGQNAILYWMAWVDDQPVQFGGSPLTNIQLSFIPEFVRLGKRVFSVEILGILVPQSSPWAKAPEASLEALGQISADFPKEDS